MSQSKTSINFNKIHSLRAEKSWSQEEVAERLHISPSQYARIERGEVSPRVEMLLRIAALFEADVLELLDTAQHFIQTQFAYSSPEATQAQQSNVYHNNYYGNDAMAAEIDKLKLSLQHKDEEIALLKEMLALLKADKN